MSSKDNEIQTYDGQKFMLPGPSVQEYIEWRNEFLNQVGQDLASKMPKLYGRIEFNIQGGKFVNANIVEGVKRFQNFQQKNTSGK